MAGAITELAHNGVGKDFPHFAPSSARILLLQAGTGDTQFDERLSAFARSSSEALGVEVHTDSRVELIDGDGVVVNGEESRPAPFCGRPGWSRRQPRRGSEPRGVPATSRSALSFRSRPPRCLCDRRYRAFARLGRPTCSRACARGEAGRRYVASVLRARLRGRKPAAVPLSPPRSLATWLTRARLRSLDG